MDKDKYENDAPAEDVDTTTISTIESRPVAWLFEPYLPMGTVTTLIRRKGKTNRRALGVVVEQINP